MTLQELRYLVALAEHGNFVRAAESCHVGQPTLSAQLKKLEEYLDVKLFERNRHLLMPTPIGRRIIEEARIALDVVARIREIARTGDDPMHGPLRLGVIPTLGPYLIPRVLPKIRSEFPDLHLFLREDLTNNLLDRLRKGRLDALLLALPVRGEEDLAFVELFQEPFTVALPVGHPLAAKREVNERDLASEKVLLLEEGHCLRDQALAICGGVPSDEREELKATSLETLRQMVAAGIGCTLLPKLAAMPGVGSLPNEMVEIRPLSAPAAYRTIGLVWRHRYPREVTVRGLAKLIKETVSMADDPQPARGNGGLSGGKPPPRALKPARPESAANLNS
jgi:LysR family hydrogen peroxide-inducible transcriptional activator